MEIFNEILLCLSVLERTEFCSGVTGMKESVLHFPHNYYLYIVFLFSFVLLLN